jgi:hypothetical protein
MSWYCGVRAFSINAGVVPAHIPPTRPCFARNSSMILVL